MKAHPWYRHYPANFLGGVVGLTVEQIGAYSVLLNLLYNKWSPIDDSSWKERRVLARFCGCSTRKFGELVAELLAIGKLRRDADGMLTNDKFEIERAKIFGTKNPGVSAANTDLKVPQDSSQDSSEDSRRSEQDQALKPKNSPQKIDSLTRARENLDTRNQNSTGDRSVDSAEKIESVLQRICRIIGVSMATDTRRADWPMQLQRMVIEQGIDVELDLIPAIETYPENIRRQATKLTFFQKRALEKRATRDLAARVSAVTDRRTDEQEQAIEQIDVSTITRARWIEYARVFLRIGAWLEDECGPSPFRPRCMLPDDVLEVVQAQWHSQGDHPLELHLGNAYVPWFADGPSLIKQPTLLHMELNDD